MVETEKNLYEQELKAALKLARDAGAAILDFYDRPLQVESKTSPGDFSEPVTQADRVANEIIVSGIRKLFPDDGILAEESVDTERRLSKSRAWMIDPVDGTRGFISRNGDFAVQIGLAVEGRSVLGVVFQPLPVLMYWAVRGRGAWIERQGFEAEQAHVSTQSDISQMRLAESRSHRSPRMDKIVSALGIKEEVKRDSVGIKVGLLIERQCDIYIHISPRTKHWDTCGPEVILEEAGGRFTDLFGNNILYNTPDVQNHNGIVATNGAAHREVIERIAPVLRELGRFPQ